MTIIFRWAGPSQSRERQTAS